MLANRFRWPTIALLLSCLVFGIVRSARGDGSEEGDEPLLAANSLVGVFEQVIRDAGGALVSTSRGHFAILKPNFFRWVIVAPGQEEVVSDGQFLWRYDIDLETVIRQPAGTQARAPLRLLVEPASRLEDEYDIVREHDRHTLWPKDANAPFQSVSVTFDEGLPAQMEILDNLDQRVFIELSAVSDESLTPEDFSFVPPDGADLTFLDG